MICPFELIVMPSTSPRFMSGEYLRKLGFESNGISGTVTVPGAGGAAGACWAVTVCPPDKCTKSAAPTTAATDRDKNRFTNTSTSDVVRTFRSAVRGRPEGLHYFLSQTQRDKFCRMLLTANRHDDVLLAL